ncbi:MAG: hypothetical protein ACLTK0_10160 [Anaerovoracaceae bacterium]
MRLIYKIILQVSLKDGVKDALNEPDSALAKYISENEDGKINFTPTLSARAQNLGYGKIYCRQQQLLLFYRRFLPLL